MISAVAVRAAEPNDTVTSTHERVARVRPRREVGGLEEAGVRTGGGRSTLRAGRPVLPQGGAEESRPVVRGAAAAAARPRRRDGGRDDDGRGSGDDGGGDGDASRRRDVRSGDRRGRAQLGAIDVGDAGERVASAGTSTSTANTETPNFTRRRCRR